MQRGEDRSYTGFIRSAVLTRVLGPFVNTVPEPDAGSDAEHAAAGRCEPGCSPIATPSPALPPPNQRTSPCRIIFARPSFPSSRACLGLYWPLGSEFNAAAALAADPAFDESDARLAICTARATLDGIQALGRQHADAWSTSAASPSSDGASVVPDVVVVPCVGFTAAGHRLGFGGGYYDRWLAAHPHVVAVGVAWSFAELDVATFAARPHDIPLAFVVTERGVR